MKIIAIIFSIIIGIVALLVGVDVAYNSIHSPQQQSQQNSPSQRSNSLEKSFNQALQSTPPHLLAGFDWRLPENTSIEPYSGLIGENNKSVKTINNAFLIVLWDQTNPQQGVYDFSRLEKKLNALGRRKALIRLEVNSACEAPKWVLKLLRQSRDKSLIFWDKNYITLLKPYVQEFARRFASSENIAGVQLGIGDGEFTGTCDNYDNKDGWGEFWMSPPVLAEAQENFGLTPELFEARSREIIELYANAFGANKAKLAFTNQGPLYSWGDAATPYNQRLEKLADYAFQLGLGTRDGGTEQWLRFIDKVYGSELTSMADGSCRLDFDEEYAEAIRGRYWGTENEFYGNLDYVLDRHGPYENQPYRFLISSLRALQMRRNFITVTDSAMVDLDHHVYKTQQFIDYLNRVMGKQIENTPDAFVLLGERYINAFRARNYQHQACVANNGNKIPIRSFGRWLEEDGKNEAQNTAAIKIRMPAEEKLWDQDYYLPDGVNYEYFARASKQFSFDLNDTLAKKRCAQGCEVEIKLTFKDTAKTALTVISAEQKSQALNTLGDNKIKTATFKLDSKFNNGLAGSDLIVKSDQHSIPLIMVRINFLK